MDIYTNRIYVNNSFTGFWPVGTGCVVMAKNAEEAAVKLANHLSSMGLTQEIKASSMTEVTKDNFPTGIAMLCDGNY